LWFFGKLLALLFAFIWVRGTVPRLRMDQLMNFAWKFNAADDPGDDSFGRHLALSTVAVVGPKPLGGVIRWLVCALVYFCAVYNAGARAGARPEDRERESIASRNSRRCESEVI